jgi:hypothetical protein
VILPARYHLVLLMWFCTYRHFWHLEYVSNSSPSHIVRSVWQLQGSLYVIGVFGSKYGCNILKFSNLVEEGKRLYNFTTGTRYQQRGRNDWICALLKILFHDDIEIRWGKRTRDLIRQQWLLTNLSVSGNVLSEDQRYSSRSHPEIFKNNFS